MLVAPRMRQSPTVALILAITGAADGSRASLDTLRFAVEQYVDELKAHSAPPERVLANVKQLVAECRIVQPAEYSSIDSMTASVSRWCIEQYFRRDQSIPQNAH